MNGLRTLRHASRSVARTLLLVLGASVALAACEAPTATRALDAYDPTALTNGLKYRWANGTRIRVYVAGAAASGFDLALATRQAMARWNAVPQFAEFTLVSASDAGSADVVVFDRATDSPVLPGTCPFDPRSSAGYTYFCVGSGSPRRAEVLPLAASATSSVRVLVRVDRGAVTSQAAYNAVVAHEFGHALGIGAHSVQSTDLMFAFPTADGPSTRDIATLRWVLGQLPGLELN